MATHSSVLAWRIPGTGHLVGFRLWGRTESDTTEVTQQQQSRTLNRREVRQFHIVTAHSNEVLDRAVGMER